MRVPVTVEFTRPSLSERDIDLLLLEEFVSSKDFGSWFSAQAGQADTALVVRASRSVTHSTGESDLEVDLIATEGAIHRLLIENKIASGFQPRQAERYRERGHSLTQNGECAGFTTVLVAPAVYLGAHPDRKGFDVAIPYEAIALWFSQQTALGPRAAYKQRLLALASEKARFGYQVQEDEPVTQFWKSYWRLASEVAPELEMDEPPPKPSGAGFVYFRPASLPSSAPLVHKLGYGRLDFQFAGMGDKLDELGERFSGRLLPGMSIAKAAKSGVVRCLVPKLSTSLAFDAQESFVSAALRQAKTMLAWYLRVQQAANSQERR